MHALAATRLLTGLLGGTFDPIHAGHMTILKALWKTKQFKDFQLIPCRQSPHRGPTHFTPQERAQRIRQAIQDLPYCTLNTLEYARPAPSYTIDTLRTLRAQFPTNRFALILGEDAFQHFTDWLHWREILKLTHVVLIPRSGYTHSLHDMFNERVTDDISCLYETDTGRIYRSTIKTPPISATMIRAEVNSK